MAELEMLQLATVVSRQPHPGLTTVDTDNYAGGKLATQHLIEQGYQTIWITSGLPENWSPKKRLKGWQDAL